jgi:tetratricopeptide (TPR) repeat protein
LFLESLSILEKINENNSKIGIQIKFFLGSLYDDMGKHEECIEILKDVLESQIKSYGEEHIFTARTINCLGIAEDNRGDLKKAREYYNKAYSIFKNL